MLQHHAKNQTPPPFWMFHTDFLKDGLAAELSRETCKGGLILQHKCLVTLMPSFQDGP